MGLQSRQMPHSPSRLLLRVQGLASVAEPGGGAAPAAPAATAGAAAAAAAATTLASSLHSLACSAARARAARRCSCPLPDWVPGPSWAAWVPSAPSSARRRGVAGCSTSATWALPMRTASL
jgi:hypothetical protein